MFKAGKFSLYDSKNTDDLNQENDENPDLACISQLQRWNAKGRGENIHPQPVMEVTGRFSFTKRFRKIPETLLGNAYRRKTCSI